MSSFFHISCCGGKIRYSPVSCFQNQCLVFSIRIIIPRIVCSVFPTGKTITWTTASHLGFQPKVSFNYICSISSECTETLNEIANSRYLALLCISYSSTKNKNKQNSLGYKLYIIGIGYQTKETYALVLCCVEYHKDSRFILFSLSLRFVSVCV